MATTHCISYWLIRPGPSGVSRCLARGRLQLIYLVCEPIIEDLGTWTVGAISADQILGVAEFVW